MVVVSLVLIGCDGEDSPGPVLPTLGTIAINTAPDAIEAPWRISGPDGFALNGAGDAELADVAVGEYVVSWDAVAGWTSPRPATVVRTLAGDQLLIITGVYVAATDAPAGFIAAPAGSFMMGSPPEEPWHVFPETRHRVTLTHDFHIGATEVTNQQYIELAQWALAQGCVVATDSVLWDNLDGSRRALLRLAQSDEIAFDGDIFTCTNADHPVKTVSWYGAAAYCDWLSLREGLTRAYDHATWRCNGGDPHTAVGYRLPTEAEWEYACRAGSTTAFANGPLTHPECDLVDPGLDALGWYCANAGGRDHSVARKLANGWGLYDMHGNVLEWCNDGLGLYDDVAIDPVGVATSDSVVVRGGGWYYYARYCRSASRNRAIPRYTGEHVGFRVARTAS
jgi:formylglycine-generating enzyme required for sulfatase activity